MPKTILADTNILLDAAMAERPNHVHALLLFDEAVYEGLEIRAASTSYKDVYYVLSKYSNEDAARKYISALMQITTPTSVDEACLNIAAKSNEPDFEDGIIRACAERDKVDLIVSRDERAFHNSTIKRITAKEYIERFCDIEEVDL